MTHKKPCKCTNRHTIVCVICNLLKREYNTSNTITSAQQWRETYWTMLDAVPNEAAFDPEFQIMCYALEDPPLHLAEENTDDRPRK